MRIHAVCACFVLFIPLFLLLYISSSNLIVYSFTLTIYKSPRRRYVSKNINLYEISNEGTKLSTHAQANFARGELATAIRKGPYQVNVLIGGYDAGKQGAPGSVSLYYLDYFGALHKVKYGAQGYAQYFCASIFDREYKENLTEEEAIKILGKCILEMKTRFMMSQPNFIMKKVDKDGVSVLSFGEDPADT